MAAGNDLEAGTSDDCVTSESRQRLRPWLISKLDKEQIPQLSWINKSEMTFKIPWKHGGKQDWVPVQAQIFMEWARHTGKYREGIDTPTYAKWKTNLRCALNKAPDIMELTDLSRKDDPNPYKVYKFLERKKKGLGISSVYTPVPQPPREGASEVPTIVDEIPLDSDHSRPFVHAYPAYGERMDSGRLPSDLNSVKSLDLMHMSDGTGQVPTELIQAQEEMDIEDNVTAAYGATNSEHGIIFTESQANEVVVQTTFVQSYHQSAPEYMQYIQDIKPPIFVKKEIDPAACNIASEPKNGSEMQIEILYRSLKMQEHYVVGEKGCRISNDNVLSCDPKNTIPGVLQDALFGVDAKDMQFIKLPEWRKDLCSEEILPSVRDLLVNMQRGLLLQCQNGNIRAMRLCKTSIYYSSILNDTSTKLMRHDSKIIDSTTVLDMENEFKPAIEPESTTMDSTIIFDMENEFKPALEQYKNKKGPRPHPELYLYIGQNGSREKLDSLLIVLKVTNCEAMSLLRDVDDDRLNSIHISEPTDYDMITENVCKELKGEHDISAMCDQDTNMSVQE